MGKDGSVTIERMTSNEKWVRMRLSGSMVSALRKLGAVEEGDWLTPREIGVRAGTLDALHARGLMEWGGWVPTWIGFTKNAVRITAKGREALRVIGLEST